MTVRQILDIWTATLISISGARQALHFRVTKSQFGYTEVRFRVVESVDGAKTIAECRRGAPVMRVNRSETARLRGKS